MASEGIAETLQDSFLSCSVCFQPYNRPKALPCLHTFCEGCLRDYVTSRHEGAPDFPCPLCRQTVHLPPEGVTGLPDNHFIIGLSDTVATYHVERRPSKVTSQLLGHPSKETTPLLRPGLHATRQSDILPANRVAPIIRRFCDFGDQPYQCVSISGIAASVVTDDVFLVDNKQNKIVTFSGNGLFRNSFQCDCSVHDVAVTRAGTLLVTVSRAGQAILREYTMEGRLKKNIGTFYAHENPFSVILTRRDQAIITGLRQNCVHVLTEQWKPSVRFGSHGAGRNHFNNPFYLTINSKDEIIVSDCGNHRIKVHSLNGNWKREFGHQGSKPGELFYPMGVCVDRYDNIYVADANNFRVQVFSPLGECLGTPVHQTYEYGVDVRPVNVLLIRDTVLLVVLQGSRLCQVHAYFCDPNIYRKMRPDQYSSLLSWCC